jgi:hypothetical protein
VFVPGLGWTLVLVSAGERNGVCETYVDRADFVFECVAVVELFLLNEDLFGVWFPDFP